MKPVMMVMLFVVMDVVIFVVSNHAVMGMLILMAQIISWVTSMMKHVMTETILVMMAVVHDVA